MPDFRFKRLEKYKVGGTADRMQLNVPLPRSPSGKVYRWCPSDRCTPRLFLMGDAQRPEGLDTSGLRRPPGASGTTCPYCGMDADAAQFNYDGDIEAIQKYIEWAASRDIADHLERMAKDFNRGQPRGGLVSIKMDIKAPRTPEPKAWREDLIRSLSCPKCGREYGVYAIALFCPDCGSRNLASHFEREIELILQQLDLAEELSEAGNSELSYRVLGNAHEDVVTAFETYQKNFYRYKIAQALPHPEAEKMTSKASIANRFQNVDRAKELYANLSIDPFSVLGPEDLELIRANIEKRHVIGHNLSMADEAYTEAGRPERPGTTVAILADDVSDFAKTTKRVVEELERLL